MTKRNENEDLVITPRKTDFSQWYLDIIRAADLAESGPVRGTMVIKPYGYAIWELVQKFLNERFKEHGIENAYFPMLIPEKFLQKESDHVEGFSPEVAVVTIAGGEKLHEPLIVRPTSETIINDVFSRWVHSHRDLPLLINQWANVVRWELRPRLFLRTTEFLWQEGHTAHATAEEADAFARTMLGVYERFARDVMAIPAFIGEKTASEKFAGALRTYAVEAMMQDGKALQFATSHNLGQNFAKAFGIQFDNEKGETQYVSQTSWGLSTRTIGGLIMTHSDDKGLVLPPAIAPLKAVIVPIWKDDTSKEATAKKAAELGKLLHDAKIDCKTDTRDIRPGEKYYEWERKGVPVRIEVGPRDIEKKSVVFVRRDTGEKTIVPEQAFVKTLTELLTDIQTNLLTKAAEFRDERTVSVTSWDEFAAAIKNNMFVSAHWDGTEKTELAIKEKTKATIRVIPFEKNPEKGECIYSKKPSAGKVIFAKNY